MSVATVDDEQFYRRVGSSIQAARKKMGLSQSQLSKRLGISRASVGNIEAGRQRIQLHLLAWIAFYLEVDIHSLVPRAIETRRTPSEQSGEDLVFTDSSARDFVEEALRQADRAAG